MPDKSNLHEGNNGETFSGDQAGQVHCAAGESAFPGHIGLLYDHEAHEDHEVSNVTLCSILHGESISGLRTPPRTDFAVTAFSPVLREAQRKEFMVMAILLNILL